MNLIMKNKKENIAELTNLFIKDIGKKFRKIVGCELEELYYFGSPLQIKEGVEYFFQELSRNATEKEAEDGRTIMNSEN